MTGVTELLIVAYLCKLLSISQNWMLALMVLTCWGRILTKEKK